MKDFVNSLRFFGALVLMSLRASWALRGAFFLQSVLMLLNNIVFFAMWLIFFHRFSSVGGWRLSDVGATYGVVALGFGLARIVGGGSPNLARMIVAGELDPVLVQPKHAMLQVAGSRSAAAAWGDVVTGVIFLVITGHLSGPDFALPLLAAIASAVGFLAVSLLFNCAAFWLGRVESLATMLSDFTLTFALYPRPLFEGSIRILLFSIIPAAFVGWYPVEAVRHPGLAPVAIMSASAAGLLALAFLTFDRGLRRYESGSRFGTWG